MTLAVTVYVTPVRSDWCWKAMNGSPSGRGAILRTLRPGIPGERYLHGRPEFVNSLDVSLAEAARVAEVSPVTLRKAAAVGQLEARKLAGRWVTSVQAVFVYLQHRRGRGRPRKMDR